MNVEIIFFGAVADAVGCRSLRVELPPVSTVSDALREISGTLSKFRSERLLHAVNEEYADKDMILTEGDKLAVFTAVSGG
jgi:molybdopterin converting factor small subunit